MKVRRNSEWENIEKSNDSIISSISFPSVSSGNMQIKNCLYDDLLPHSIKSSPITSLSKEDNLWIATSMLSRISNISNDIVVMEKEYPVGIIGADEILTGLLKNPTAGFFEKHVTKEIMNRKFYLDTRKATLSKIIEQLDATNDIFAIIQNSKYDFSAISTREILEIGSMAESNINAGEKSNQKIVICNRDDTVKEILQLLTQKNADYLVLENESLILDRFSIINKITSDLEYLEDVDNFLELNASIFQYNAPKLIPEGISFSEICKIMLEMNNPYCITKNRIWSSKDILKILNRGVNY